MYQIQTLNKISKKGLAVLDENYTCADETENPDGIRLERPDLERGRRFNQLAADGKREYITRHRGSGKDKKILQRSNMERRTLVGIHIQP